MRSERDFFNEVARQYRESSVLVPGASFLRNLILDKAMKRALVTPLTRLSGKKILEVGCGVGRWTKMMAQHNLVVSVDLSKAMIKIAKKNSTTDDQFFVVADASFLPFNKNSFDLVVSITVIQHILNSERLSKSIFEIARCTQKTLMLFEEMWSQREFLLKGGFCPIRIMPLKEYIKNLESNGVKVYYARGVTLAPLTVLLARMFSYVNNSKPEIQTSIFKKSKVLAWLLHLLMGVGVLPAILMPKSDYPPFLSLHSKILAKKPSPR